MNKDDENPEEEITGKMNFLTGSIPDRCGSTGRQYADGVYIRRLIQEPENSNSSAADPNLELLVEYIDAMHAACEFQFVFPEPVTPATLGILTPDTSGTQTGKDAGISPDTK